MTELKLFLEKSFNSLKDWNSLQEIHIVLGNESCDLDSTVSSLAYGFYLYKKMGLENSTDKTVFPVLNVSPENFLVRSEHCFLFRKLGIDLDKLIYRSQMNFEEITKSRHSSKTLETYLVDHHVLSRNDRILMPTVCQIFDHRPLDETHGWPEGTQMRIEQVGSCATIIGDEIFKGNGDIWTQELAYLVNCTILLDTKGLCLKKGKVSPLDTEIVSKLKHKFNLNEDGVSLFKELRDLRCEICDLSPSQMLRKDLKFSSDGTIAFPRMHLLAKSFIELEGALVALEYLCHEKKTSIVVLIGSDRDTKEKDLGVYFGCSETPIQIFIDQLRGETVLKEVPSKIENFVLFKLIHSRLTRKQIIPMVLNIQNQKPECRNTDETK